MPRRRLLTAPALVFGVVCAAEVGVDPQLVGGLATLVGIALAATDGGVEGYRTAFRWALGGLVLAAVVVGLAGRPARSVRIL